MKISKLLIFTVVVALLLGGCTQTKDLYGDGDIVDPKDKESGPSTYELNKISDKLYMNETGGNDAHLMFWSKNEVFPSLGIGHFIWYPTGQAKRFDETFPAMIQYYVDKKTKDVPEWLIKQKDKGAPWADRATFERSRNDPQFKQLKYLLMNTKNLQTEFFFDRLEAAIPEIVEHVSKADATHVKNSYNAVAKSPGGWYPLIDYINFKGKGIKSTEKYNGKGWGLLQVLQTMRPIQAGPGALREFSRAADIVLKRRIQNSPPQNKERENWMSGWKVRTDSYAQTIY